MGAASDHAYLAPSSAHIWGPGGCPAFPRMARLYPDQGDDAAAREGEAAHHWLTETIRDRPSPLIGSLAPNGHPITDEMVECGAAMAVDVFTLRATPGLRWAVEQSVKMPRVHADNWGRCDFGAVDEAARVLYVWDYKFGHRYVDVFENWQLIDYAEGLANLFMVTLDATWTIDARIYQPRSYHADGQVKRWPYAGTKHHEYVHWLSVSAMDAMRPDAPMSTGEHCSDCPARHACPALQRVGGLAVDMSLQAVPHELTPANAGLLLRTIQAARERLEDLETGLEAQVMAAVRAGASDTGWEVFQGYGREKWTQPAHDVVAMGKMLGKDLAKPLEPVTPAQARKLGIDAAVISAYSTKPPGEIKLRPLDSRQVRKAFQ